MKSKTYSLVTNVAIACGVVAALTYDYSGAYSWAALVIAAISAIVTAVAYFRFHWSARAPNTANRAENCVEDAPVIANPLVEHNAVIPGASHWGMAAHMAPIDDHESDHALAIRRELSTALSNQLASYFSQTVAWKLKTYDSRALAHLLTQLEKERWSVSGTLNVRHPEARDLTLSVILLGETMRLVPTITGGRAGTPRQKHPSSQPALRFAR